MDGRGQKVAPPVVGLNADFSADREPIMKRRHPYQMRFLLPLSWAVLALTLDWAIHAIQLAVCGMLPTGARCPAVFPTWLGLALLLTVPLAFAACAYRYWRDFILGEYYLDLEDPHWRDR